MVRLCCVPNCPNSRAVRGVDCYPFPSADAALRGKWISFVGANAHKFRWNTKYICAEHFHQLDLVETDDGRREPIEGAVPKVYSPDEDQDDELMERDGVMVSGKSAEPTSQPEGSTGVRQLREIAELRSLFCRICLKKGDGLIPLNSKLRNENLLDIIYTITGLAIETEEELPTKVCGNCVGKLDMAFNVRVEFQHYEEILWNLIKNKQLEMHYQSYDSWNDLMNNQDVTIEQPEEPLDSTVNAVESVKIKPVVVNLTGDDELLEEIEEEHLSDEDTLSCTEDIPADQKAEDANRPSPKNDTIKQLIVKIESDSEEELVSTDKHLQTHLFPYPCDYCSLRYLSRRAYITHMHSAHAESDKEEYICDDCGQHFARKSAFSVHVSKHKAITEGRSHFEKDLTQVVSYGDGSMIAEDEVLEILSSEGHSEEWSPIEHYAQRSTQQTQNNQKVLPSTSRSVKRKATLKDVEEPPHKHTVLNTSKDDNHSVSCRNPLNESYFFAIEVTSSNDEADESILSEQEDFLFVPCTSESSSDDVDTPTDSIPPQNPVSQQLANFEVNWKAIPHDILDELEGRRPNAGCRGISETNYNRLVDHITAQIRTISTKIPMFFFRKVALKISSKYTILRDCGDDDLIIGVGTNRLVDKLKNHNSYLNKQRTERHTTHNKCHVNRQCTVGVREQYRNSGRDYCSMENLQIILSTETVEDFSDEVLSGTEAYIRYKIDNAIDLQSLHHELPVIRKKAVLYHHFMRATGCSADAFTKNFATKRTTLIAVSRTYKSSLHISSAASDGEVLQGIAKILGENLLSLVHPVKDSHELDKIEGNLPCILLVKRSSGRQKYYIHADHSLLTSGCKNIITAFQQLLVVHFVYFFNYRKDISQTLEFFQIYLMKLHSVNGTRSTATTIGKQQGLVTSLIYKISQFEWKKSKLSRNIK